MKKNLNYVDQKLRGRIRVVIGNSGGSPKRG